MLTTTYVPGAPNWLDLGSPDVDAAAAFYGALFGWELLSHGTGGRGYGFFRLNGKTVAAIGPLTEEGASSAWTPYFLTADADATTRAVEQAGGTVRVPPMDVFTEGRMAAYTDPTGAQFAVWQPGDTKGLDAVNDVNTLSWTELYTTDAAAAKDFYRSVFSWDYQDMPFAGVTYTVVSPSGGGQERHAGRHHAAPEGEPGGGFPLGVASVLRSGRRRRHLRRGHPTGCHHAHPADGRGGRGPPGHVHRPLRRAFGRHPRRCPLSPRPGRSDEVDVGAAQQRIVDHLEEGHGVVAEAVAAAEMQAEDAVIGEVEDGGAAVAAQRGAVVHHHASARAGAPWWCRAGDV